MRKVDIQNERVRVVAYFNETGSVLRGDKQGVCDGFEIEFSVDSGEALDVIKDLIRLAHQMCFTESALQQVVQIKYTHRLNGEVI